jgi:hypothetical protein
MLKHPMLKPATKQALLSLVIALGLLTPGCGTNPVTKKRELQLVSESQEIAIGKKNYGPTRQAQGGDYTLDTIVGAPEILARGGRVDIFPTIKGHSSTGIIARAQKSREEVV